MALGRHPIGEAIADGFGGRLLRELQGRGLSLREMAAELAARGITALRGGAWTATGVQRVLERAGVA